MRGLSELRPTAHQTEKSFMQTVLDFARLSGWRCYHTLDSRRSEAGFPDLVLVRGAELLFVELKTDRGVLSREQREWLDALATAGQRIRVWRPRDWVEILEELRRRY